MKRILSTILITLSFGLSGAPAGSPQQAYIAKYSAIAVSEMHRSGVPASITLAQGLLESNSGRSELATKGNNHFGIKCHDWKGRRMYFDDDRRNECFRKYSHAEESFRDHSDFLRYRDRYKFLFDLRPSDYKGWAYGLKKAGYATDPAYPAKLIRLIEEYDLTRFDSGRKSGWRPWREPAGKSEGKKPEKKPGKKPVRKPAGNVPAPPSELERPVPVKKGDFPEFTFSLNRQMYSQNRVPFVYAMEGETYADIARRYNLFPKEIMRFNDAEYSSRREASGELLPGSVVYLQAKKSRAAKNVDKHVINEGETLREIAQRYGVKMKSLQKMNGLEADAPLREGDMLRLR